MSHGKNVFVSIMKQVGHSIFCSIMLIMYSNVENDRINHSITQENYKIHVVMKEQLLFNHSWGSFASLDR